MTKKPRTLLEVQQEYITSPQWRRLSYGSQRIYINGMDSLLPFQDKLITEIRRPDIIEFRDSLERQPGKCRVALSVLNNLFKLAYDKGWVDSNPATGVGGLPAPKKLPRWEEREIDLFIALSPDYVANAVSFALYTGQRGCDLIKIRWEDYDGRFIAVKQRKTGKKVFIPVHPKLRSTIEKIERVRLAKTGRQSPYMLHSFAGEPWSTGALNTAVARYVRKLGILGKSLHGIRKSTASILRESGCSWEEIMAILGHTSITQSQNYAEEADLKQLAEAAMAKWK